MPYLVNAHHVKTVPGRTSDWNDAQWLQKLHALGLLAASFRPDREITALCTLVRYRAELIRPKPNRNPRMPPRLTLVRSMRAFWGRSGRGNGLVGLRDQTIINEIGTDLCRFPTVRHFCAWLGLVPRNDISGGKMLRSQTNKVVNRATQAFRQAAQSVSRSDSAIGAYYRTMRVRKGPQQTTVATAHKIARIVYHLLKYGEAYEAESAGAYEQSNWVLRLRRCPNRSRLPATDRRKGEGFSPSKSCQEG